MIFLANGNPAITARTRAVSIVYNDLLWIIGGTKNPAYTKLSQEFDKNNFNSIYQFDYQQQFFQFIPTTGTAVPKGWGYASAVLNQRFYLFGGAKWAPNCLAGSSDLFEFDPSTFNWRLIKTSNTPPPRYGAALASFTNVGGWPYTLILFGGVHGGSEAICNNPYQNDMWKLSFNDVSQLDTQLSQADWEVHNYTSWSPTEPYGQAHMHVAQENDCMYIYGGVYGNYQRKVLKNIWEYNATENKWRPLATATGALPYSCSASAIAQPNTLQRVTYGSLTNNTGGLFWVTFGGYLHVDRRPWIPGIVMNVLFNLAPPAASVLTDIQVLWFAVLGPIVSVFLILLFIYFYRRSQDLSAAGRISMSYKQLNDPAMQSPESLLAGLKDGEVPEDPALYFQMMQNQERGAAAAANITGTASSAPGGGRSSGQNGFASASVYSPMQNASTNPAGYTASSAGGSIGGSVGYIPGGTAYGVPNGTGVGVVAGTAYGQVGGTAYGQVGGTAYGQVGGYGAAGYGGTAYGQVGGTAYGQVGGTAYGQVAGAAYGNGAYGNYANPGQGTGATLIGEVGRVHDPASVTNTAGATIIEEIGSVNRGDYSGTTGLTMIEEIGSVNRGDFTGTTGLTMIQDVGMQGGQTIIDNASMVQPQSMFSSNVQQVPSSTYDAPTVVETVNSTYVDTAELVSAAQVAERQSEVPTVIETAHNGDAITSESEATAVQATIEEPIPSTIDILEQEVANARNRAVSSYPLPDDAEEHISSFGDSVLSATVNMQMMNNVTQVETASVGFPDQLNLATNLEVTNINSAELITDLWSGPIRVAMIGLETASEAVKENAKGLEVAAVKFWSPNRSLPDEVVDVLARRETLILNFLRNTPNVIQFIGFALSPLRILTRVFNSTLHQELHDSSNFKWSEPDVKRMAINDLITGFLYIHGKGIIHNRLNPKTVMIQYTQERDGPTAVIGDFSNAMMVGTDTDSPMNTGAFVAMQYRYIAPEILNDLKPSFAEMARICSQASDVFSFGMVVYEIVSRAAPFYEFSEEEARGRILSGEQPSLPPDFQAAYSKYDELVRAATSRDPDTRPGDFLQIRQFFENI